MDWMTILIIALIAAGVFMALLYTANKFDMFGDLLGQ